MNRSRSLAAALGAMSLTLVACGGAGVPPTEAAPAITGAESGVRVVSPETAAATIADAPEGLVVLDVRTPEEFAEGHLDGAVLLDFYEPDFADRLAELDPDVPYVLYCRSGNRSGQARAMMDELGFSSVADVDGGILSWQAGGLPVTTD